MNINYTVKEIVTYMNCSESLIRRLTRENILPHFKMGAKLLYPKDKIDIWINEQTNINY